MDNLGYGNGSILARRDGLVAVDVRPSSCIKRGGRRSCGALGIGGSMLVAN